MTTVEDTTPRAPLRILCAEPENFSARGLAEVAKLGLLHAQSLSQSEFAEQAAEHDVLMLRLRLHLTDAILAGNGRPPLAVLSPTTGVNHLALPSAERLGVPIFHLRGEREFLDTIHSTAEHTFGLLLALARKLAPAVASTKRGQWHQVDYRGRELAGKRLGIIGFGRLGSIVARYAAAFDMDVSTFDPYVSAIAGNVVRRASLEELCQNSDVLSIHASLSETTEGLVGPKELNALPMGALLVNTARGELLQEDALLAALESGRLAGAALDVLANEHSSVAHGSAVLEYTRTHDNLIITPHIGGATAEAVERTDLFTIEKFAHWYRAGHQHGR